MENKDTEKIMIARAYTSRYSFRSDVKGPVFIGRSDIEYWIDEDVDEMLSPEIYYEPSLQYIVTHEDGKSDISPIVKYNTPDETIQTYNTKDTTKIEIIFWKTQKEPKIDTPNGTLEYKIEPLPKEDEY